jgi:two-component system response regulator
MTTPRHILLVEDNPDDEALTLRAFAKNGIENPVVVARDGLEAVERLFSPNSLGRPPDLKLPRIDGLEVLRRIRAHESTALLPVVILTTSGESRDIHQSYQLGANSYIRKPVDYQHFVEAVGAIVAYWLKLNMPADGY